MGVLVVLDYSVFSAWSDYSSYLHAWLTQISYEATQKMSKLPSKYGEEILTSAAESSLRVHTGILRKGHCCKAEGIKRGIYEGAVTISGSLNWVKARCT